MVKELLSSAEYLGKRRDSIASGDRSLATMLLRAWSSLAVFVCNACPKPQQVRARVTWIRFVGLHGFVFNAWC